MGGLAETNRTQFDKQAEAFRDWSAASDTRYFPSLATFVRLSDNDTLLDVGCGSGAFVLFASHIAKSAAGIDISGKQLGLTKKEVHAENTTNVHFMQGNVEHMPLPDAAFSVILCKSSFHHFRNFQQVLDEMYRCCVPGGRICITDLTTYDSPDATVTIDEMDKLIDISHNRRLSIKEFNTLFYGKTMKIAECRITESVHSVREYQSHAFQTPENAKKIDGLIADTLTNSALRPYIFTKNEEPYFINRGYMVVGIK